MAIEMMEPGLDFENNRETLERQRFFAFLHRLRFSAEQIEEVGDNKNSWGTMISRAGEIAAFELPEGVRIQPSKFLELIRKEGFVEKGK